MLRIPGVPHHAEIADQRATPVGKLVQVQFSQQHCAGISEAADDLCVPGWNPVLEQSAGGGSADSGSVDQVLETQGDTVQRATPVAPCNLGFGLPRLR